MEMFNPPIRAKSSTEDCLEPSTPIEVTEAALRLGVSRQSMSSSINGRAASFR